MTLLRSSSYGGRTPAEREGQRIMFGRRTWRAHALVALLVLIVSVLSAVPTWATYKPDYSKVPAPVRQWFRSAEVPGWAEFEKCRDAVYMSSPPGADTASQILACGLKYSPAYVRLNLRGCCDEADRLKTKFIPSRDGDWSYYPDPECTRAGCPLLPIPSDVLEYTPIAPPPGSLTGLSQAEIADVLAIFARMRMEGVLFIHKGRPSCFWPPQHGG